MEVGNDIKLVNGQWSFYNGVAKHFDDHVNYPFHCMKKVTNLFVT